MIIRNALCFKQLFQRRTRKCPYYAAFRIILYTLKEFSQMILSCSAEVLHAQTALYSYHDDTVFGNMLSDYL